MDMTKRAIKAALGFDTDAELARFFGIGRWAVGQWADDQPIPQGRQWQLRATRPDVFAAAAGEAPSVVPANDEAGDDPARQTPAANEGDAAPEDGTQVPRLSEAA